MASNNSKRKVNNLLKNNYVTDATIWSVDETCFTESRFSCY